MQAAIYARYSSENQRPESIDDQISSCRKLAKERQYDVEHGHIYTDAAASGAREDRPGLAALRAAAVAGEFRALLIDDLSRLARNTLLLLSVLEGLRFHGVRVVSVADGLDTDDQDATVGIQMRGVFNELQLMDLRKKTLRGQIGQKQRGFIVGEATYGYRSVAVGEIRMDKKGRPRPEGYKMTVDPREAAVILRVFKEFADGSSESRVVKRLNAEGHTWTAQNEEGMVASNDSSAASEREIHRPVGLESDRNAARPEDRSAAPVSEAGVRVVHLGRPVAQNRSTRAVGANPAPSGRGS